MVRIWNTACWKDRFFPTGSLREATFKGGLWTLLSVSATGLTGMVSSVVLARLLTPEIFGTVGIVFATLGVVEGVTTPGVWQALIQRREAVEPVLDTAWTLQVLRGMLLTAAVFFAAPHLAAFFRNPHLAPLFRVLSFSFLLRGLSNIALVRLNRAMRFGRLAVYNQVTGCVSLVVQLVLVCWLRNVWALVWGALVLALVRSLGSYVMVPRRNRFRWNRAYAAELLHFGKYIWGSSVAFFLLSRGDRLVIGRLMGEAGLGWYIFAYALAMIPPKYATSIVSQVTYPAFSRIQDQPERLRSGFEQLFSWISMVVLPFAALLWCLAPDLVYWVYGSKWMAAVPILRVLLILGVCSTFSAVMYPLFRAVHRPRLDFVMNAAFLGTAALCIVPFTHRFGVLGAAAVMSGGGVIRLAVGFLGVRACIRLGTMRLVKPALFYLGGAVVAGITVCVVRGHEVAGRGIFGAVGGLLAGMAVYGLLIGIAAIRGAGEGRPV